MYTKYLKTLNLAITQGNVSVVTNLLNQGLKDFPVRISKEPLLFTAIDYGQSEIVKLLYQFQLTEKIMFQKKHVCYYASEKGQVECLRSILPHVDLIDLQERPNMNPLDVACKSSCPTGDYEGTVNLLITQIPDLINQSDGHGNKPLTTALIHKQIKLAQILLDHGADVDFINHQDSHLFCSAIQCGDTQIINTILERLPFPAHISAQCGYLPYFEQHNCLELIDDLGNTPLHSAVYGEQDQLVDWFISQSINLNAQNEEGSTPLHYATALDYPDILEKLLKARADLNIRDKDGRTPLYRLEYNVNSLQILLDYGADPLVKDNHDLTAKDWLKSLIFHSKEIVELLEETELMNLSIKSAEML